jgi:hypothetical protein
MKINISIVPTDTDTDTDTATDTDTDTRKIRKVTYEIEYKGSGNSAMERECFVKSVLNQFYSEIISVKRL